MGSYSILDLRRLNRSLVSIGVRLLCLSPSFGGDIEMESLVGVREDLVGQSVGDLLEEGLSHHVGRTCD